MRTHDGEVIDSDTLQDCTGANVVSHQTVWQSDSHWNNVHSVTIIVALCYGMYGL